MQKPKMKKGLAFALAASMVIGSSLTAFAADATSGELTGTGDSNGHLEKKAVKVVLPTTTGVNYFNYTVDPEKLIDSTGKDHQGQAVTSNANNVYFKKADGTYDSTSELLTVENQSSVAIDLTVKAEVPERATDMALADAEADVASATDALLYLGLKVGDATEVVKEAGASKTVQIAGVADNFEVKAKDGGGYEYAQKASPAAWQKTTIGLTGKCNNKDIAADATAPDVKVTWSWVDPSATVAGGLFYDSSTNDWWLGTSESAGFTSGITLGAVTVNGQSITGTKTEFEGEDWVVVKWSDYVDAGFDQDETEYDFTAVVNGTTYTFHYTYPTEG